VSGNGRGPDYAGNMCIRVDAAWKCKNRMTKFTSWWLDLVSSLSMLMMGSPGVDDGDSQLPCIVMSPTHER
jgi:hypothetical protein